LGLTGAVATGGGRACAGGAERAVTVSRAMTTFGTGTDRDASPRSSPSDVAVWAPSSTPRVAVGGAGSGTRSATSLGVAAGACGVMSAEAAASPRAAVASAQDTAAPRWFPCPQRFAASLRADDARQPRSQKKKKKEQGPRRPQHPQMLHGPGHTRGSTSGWCGLARVPRVHLEVYTRPTRRPHCSPPVGIPTSMWPR
jgi:hypothetical protein